MSEKRVIIGFPGPPRFFESFKAIIKASHPDLDVNVLNSTNGFDDMNQVWAGALNAFEMGHATHFAMLHTDVFPQHGWLDVLLAELDAHNADLVSVPVAIKDDRGLTSSGIGNPENRWGPLKRFHTVELERMPETFGIEATEYPDKFLLHNTGCLAIDMRQPRFREMDSEGGLRCLFDFPTKIERGVDGKWVCRRESEDWFFSRRCWQLDIKTIITRKVVVNHRGTLDYPNSPGWGAMEADEDIRERWEAAA